MSRERRNIEFEESREEIKRSFSFKNLLSGNVLNQKNVIKQAPFFVMILLISLLAIANRNHAEKLVIQANRLENEVKELRSNSISTSSELMKISRESKVKQMVQARGLGLEENREPLRKLIIEE